MKRLAVVGGNAAGMSAAAVARRRDPSLDVLVLERGVHASYSSCGIPYLVGGTVGGADRLIARSPEDLRRAGIDVRTGCEVTRIDLRGRTLTYRDGGARTERREGFDELVYATGAVAIAPPVPGAESVEAVRTLDAAERLVARLTRARGRTAVVIGAGYLGLEMAEALASRGLEVALVDRERQVMSSLDADMAGHVQAAAEGAGIRVMLGVDVREIAGGPDGGPRVVRTTADDLHADHVVVSTGARPATELAAAAGLELGRTGGLRVDDHQRCAGHEGVYAAGDCAESRHRLLPHPVNVQLGTHANKQGRVAGTNATGGDVAFPGVIGTAISRICRHEVARTGLSETEAAAVDLPVVAATIEDSTRARYYPGAGPIWVKVVAHAETGRLLGGQIVGVEGAAKRIDVLATAVWTGMSAGELELIDLGYAPPFAGVYDPLLIAARQAAHRVRAPAPRTAPRRTRD
ncbi:FAD-dependent oxidoreductase [Miltoncostaea marina]|uniref:FAD-dependent oxidoreductase n=1 Tax=Miltoncostaea marina TaxID=2843215 RepID=UPI001C3E7F9D|nr:FAD-dependent oxidoreductase [Miltoncostaea marina]